MQIMQIMQSVNQYTIQLDGKPGSPNKKYGCPVCGCKNSFRRYYNYETREYLADECGMCDRINKCANHLTPKEWYSLHPEQKSLLERKPIETFEPKPLVHIPVQYLTNTLNGYEENSFIKSLLNYFPVSYIEKAIADYYLGSIQWLTDQDKAVVFWYLDYNNNVRAGQIKQFDNQVKTIAVSFGEVEFKAYWIHKILKKHYQTKRIDLPEWLKAYEESEKVNCLYGEHLLSKYPNKPIGLVEAPKTAIIASIVYPNYLWLATSSLSYLTKERCKVLKGRQVILFPDCGIPNSRTGKTCLDEWKERVSEFESFASFTFSALLEDKTTKEQKESGFDLADLILQDVSKTKFKIVTEDIKSILSGKLRTGNEFGNLVFATIELKNGSLVELLLDKDENIITSHEKIKPIEKFFEKSFFEGLIDETECLMNIPKEENNEQ